MSKYDAEKDELVEDLGEVEGTDMFACLKKYDDGEEKLVVVRKFGKDKSKEKQELRLSVETAVALARFIINTFDSKKEKDQ